MLSITSFLVTAFTASAQNIGSIPNVNSAKSPPPSPSPTNFFQWVPPPILGAYGQNCQHGPADDPSQCRNVGNMLDIANDAITCSENFDCCICGSIICGPNCQSLNCFGDSSCFGVKDIQLYGSDIAPTAINCDGHHSCEGTMIDGSNIGSIGCRGDHSCAQSMVTISCQKSPLFGPAGCRLDCLGDNACEGKVGVSRASRFVVANSMGLLCGHESCRYGSFALNSNLGGRLVCGGDSACLGSSITINNIDALYCSGPKGCQYAEILVINPVNGFKVLCSGRYSCQGMKLEVIVTNPAMDYMESVLCRGVGSCKDVQITVTKDVPRWATNRNLVVGELECESPESCRNAMFDLGTGVQFGRCSCGRKSSKSCENLLGVKGCLGGLQKLECVGSGACDGMTETVVNPQRDFQVICGNDNSCTDFTLNIEVDPSRGTVAEFFKGIICAAPKACNNLKVNINNTSPTRIGGGFVECSPQSSCVSAQFNYYGVDLDYVKCGESSSCVDCTKVIDGMSRPCE